MKVRILLGALKGGGMGSVTLPGQGECVVFPDDEKAQALDLIERGFAEEVKDGEPEEVADPKTLMVSTGVADSPTVKRGPGRPPKSDTNKD